MTDRRTVPEMLGHAMRRASVLGAVFGVGGEMTVGRHSVARAAVLFAASLALFVGGCFVERKRSR